MLHLNLVTKLTPLMRAVVKGLIPAEVRGSECIYTYVCIILYVHILLFWVMFFMNLVQVMLYAAYTYIRTLYPRRMYSI